jgi:hypothetical protein
MQQTEWEAKVKSELPVLGHRNWLVIADSAYPAQVSAGVQTVYTGAQQLEVVKGTLEALAATKHVRPVIYLDAELSLVPENLAPGVGEYRKSLEQLLQGKQVSRLPHDQLIAKLDEAGKTFRVLLLKTDLTIPYTSVFMELDCGYWSPEAEQKLRAAMAK